MQPRVEQAVQNCHFQQFRDERWSRWANRVHVPNGKYRRKMTRRAREEAGSNDDEVIRAVTFKFCSRFVMREEDDNLWWGQR